MGFLSKTFLSITKYGMGNMRRAILQGQYQFPEGIFFGGKTFEPHVSLIRDEVMSVGAGFEQILLIDLHTGYGQKGKLHLFGDRSPYIDEKFMSEVFRGLSVDYGEEKDFYSVTGGFTVFLAKLFHEQAKFSGIVFEFGTIDSHTMKGSLESLYRMVNESSERELFSEMFYPADSAWRTAVYQQFLNKMKTIFRNFQAISF
jgi:hypothetical protein